MIKSTIICDSVYNGNRITTFEIEYPRFILAEFNTHRVFSRNSMSSRAVPIEKMIDQVKDTPAMPVEWGLNKSGMQAEEYYSDWEKCEEEWRRCAFHAVQSAKELQALGLHKQIVNRVLEPFQMMKTVVTSTEWDNFFELRTHKDTQPEFQALAKLMKEQYDTNTPQELYEGYWHLPYVETWVHPDAYQGVKGLYKVNGQCVSEEDAIKISASCCAQVSYRVNDNSLDKALKIYDKLIKAEPPHCFSEDTEVLTLDGFKLWKDVNENDLLFDVDENTLEGKGFVPPLQLIKNNFSGNMYEIDNNNISFCVTDGHKMIGDIVSTPSSRTREFSPRPFIIGDSTSSKAQKETLGEQEARLPTAIVQGVIDDYSKAFAKLVGFYIGDGFKIDNTIGFHLKKERKLKYLEEILLDLNLEYSKRENKNGSFHYRIYKCGISDEILSNCNWGSRDKRIGEWDYDWYYFIFDGLKNSDGSVKRNTWTFSTTSEKLKEDFLTYAPLASVTVSEHKKMKDCYKLGVFTKNYQRVNDSRNPASRVSIKRVENEPVYCATMPSGALVVRRNGKVLISGNCSPFEHQAKAASKYSQGLEVSVGEVMWDNCEDGVTAIDIEGNFWSGNFKNWIQYRQLL